MRMVSPPIFARAADRLRRLRGSEGSQRPQSFPILGTPDDVLASLGADTVLARATDLTVQSHSIDPPHPFILRSIELVADVVAPALGWARHDEAAAEAHHLTGGDRW